ncbi:unnamed protein product [Strongylus vulgaris]|uniref:DNA endonuclease Ctp1 N-terminal domain-containing protein n=1 Tax=Strongylus vulgaris TaxID=40348 RepID=A0A3P7I6S3_STRVU|nr:unnamed protein product [Strongylus vulgaris]
MMSHIEEEHLSAAQGDRMVQTDASSLGEELEKMQTSFNEFKERHDAEVMQLNDHIRELVKEKENLESRRVEFEHERAALKEQISVLNEQVRQLTELVAAEKERCNEALNSLKQNTTDYEEKAAALMFDLEEKTNNVTRLEEELEEAKKMEAELQSRLKASHEHSEQLENQIGSLKAELNQANTSLAEERAQGDRYVCFRLT